MGEPTKISIADALREEKRKEIIALHKTRPEYFIYMEIRTESDPVTPKVSIPSKRKWEKEFYLWRNAITSIMKVIPPLEAAPHGVKGITHLQ